MKNITISLIVCIILATASCAPVRSGKYVKKPARASSALSQSNPGENNSESGQNSSEAVAETEHSASASGKEDSESGWDTQSENTGRFSDTTIVYLPPVNLGVEGSIGSELETTIEDFNSENYDSACEKFKNLANTLIKGDSLHYECMFYEGECEIMKENYSSAINLLKQLLGASNLPNSVLERTLVRLGQLYCVGNKPKEAKKLFDRLRAEFPTSIYIPLANCDAVQYK